MTLAALSKNLRESLKQGLRFHLVSDGNVTSGLANELLKQAQPRLETFGPYTLLHSPQVPDLWQALVHESAGNNTLVILPPASTAETEILLQQLPNTAPPGAAVALFTSGTSGEAKAVFHSVRSLLASALQLARALPGKNPSCSLLPAWGMAGFAFHCLLPGLRGGSHLFSSQPFFQWSGRAGEIFQTLDLDFVSLNPFLLEMFCRGGIPPGWKGKIISLTAPLKDQLKSELKQRWNREAEEIYGMTEAAGPVLFEGKSLGAEIRLGQDQELELRGEQLFLGYGIEGSFEPQRDWFRSGDIFEEKDRKSTRLNSSHG
mgnify:FL=1